MSKRRKSSAKEAVEASAPTVSGPLHLAGTVEEWPLDRIKPYPKNAKKHPMEQVKALARQFREHGFDVPIVVDAEGVILKGHGRLLAAQYGGFLTAPVIVRSDLTPAQARAVRLADNKLAETDWDMALVNEELRELAALDFDVDLTGFDFELGHARGDGEGVDGSDPNYTKKIKSPVYVPKGDRPAVSELYDTTRSQALYDALQGAELPQDVRVFLEAAAQRHTVFNYDRIAEFYAHAPREIQQLMEESALVIIDFGAAIEKGFVQLTKDMAEAFTSDEPTEA